MAISSKPRREAIIRAQDGGLLEVLQCGASLSTLFFEPAQRVMNQWHRPPALVGQIALHKGASASKPMASA